ncbi:MAG: hypothetical protein B7C24_06160 [Bacteroidetes bacterium 4572_77]|nr:MAG: hypothetical protein B7C24_06160 [Bacteroidetes bacterium 4572_77]
MRIIIVVFFLLVCPSIWCQEYVYAHNYLVKVGEKAPEFTAQLQDGSLFKLHEQRGKIVMLQFTASWCVVCRKEMPYIEKDIWLPLQHKDFVLIGVDYKENMTTTKKFANQMNTTYPMAVDSTGDIFHLYAQKGAGVTRNVIINKEGYIIHLTRLFNLTEFNHMKEVIFKSVNKD